MQSDAYNFIVRHIIMSSGVVSTLAGLAGSVGSTDGVATNARFYHPMGIIMDPAGTFAVVVRTEGLRALLRRMAGREVGRF